MNYSINKTELNVILSHKQKKSVYFAKEIYEVRALKKIEVYLSQEKINLINYAYQKELQNWKKVALDSVSTKNEVKK